MPLRLTTSTALPAAGILSLLASCGGQDDIGPGDGGVLFDTGVIGFEAGAIGGLEAGATGGLEAGASACPGGPGGGSAGPGSPGGGGAIPATFDTVKLVFGGGSGIMPCSAAPCHGINGAAPPEHPLELPPNDDAQLYQNLLSYVSNACNAKLVDPCNPAQSALVMILKGPCGVTPRMPYGCSPEAGDCIPDEYVDAVSQWIANGATR